MNKNAFTSGIPGFTIRFAVEKDTDLILEFIESLADYEKLSHQVVASSEKIREHLFGNEPKAEVIIGDLDNEPVAFALFFHNFSTFLGKPGIYLEDLFVRPDDRGKGYGKAMLAFLAKLAKERDCGRLEWWVLDWNKPAISFYNKLDAEPMDEWTTFRLTGDALNRLASEF